MEPTTTTRWTQPQFQRPCSSQSTPKKKGQLNWYIDLTLKGQLQHFQKLISNDRIWPSEHGFKVIFEKSLFVFEISAIKVRNKRRIHSRFHSFSENNNRETFVCDVTSDQSSMISTDCSGLRDCKASGNCYVWWFLEEIMVYCVAYDCLMIVGRPKAFHPTNFKQTTKEGCKP